MSELCCLATVTWHSTGEMMMTQTHSLAALDTCLAWLACNVQQLHISSQHSVADNSQQLIATSLSLISFSAAHPLVSTSEYHKTLSKSYQCTPQLQVIISIIMHIHV